LLIKTNKMEPNSHIIPQFTFAGFPEMTPPYHLLEEVHSKYKQDVLNVYKEISDRLLKMTKEEYEIMLRENGFKDPYIYTELNDWKSLSLRDIPHMAHRLITETKDDKIFHDWLLRLYEYNNYYRGYISKTDRDKLTKVYNIIIDNLKERGYIYKYFIFIKENSYMYQLNINNTRLEYDIASSGLTLIAPYDVTEHAFNLLRGTLSGSFPYQVVTPQDISTKFRTLIPMEEENNITYKNKHGTQFIGWKRSELIAALKESELFKEEVTEISPERYVYRYPNLGKATLNIRKRRELPIFDLLSKYRLEYLYQYINTNRAKGTPLNFKKLCRMRYVDLPTMHRMLKKFLPILYNVFEDKSLQEICEQLSLRGDMLTFIPERGAAIKYHPGGRYEKEAAEELLPGSREEYKLNQLYQKYIDRCNDPTLDILEIVFDMHELEIFNIAKRGMTKEQLCVIITRYLRDVLKYRFDDKGL
jgi:hypothetical protein